MIHVMATAITAGQFLLAEGGGGGGGGGASQGPGNNFQVIWIGLLLAVLVFWFITIRGNSRDKKKRQAMLDDLSKSDRVLTIGGIIGTVVAVKDGEVVVKVDETTNTKMTFSRSAIQKVLTDEDDVEKK